MDNLQKLISYTVIATNYDNSKDVFESFLPILYKIIDSITSSKLNINVLELKSIVEEQSGLKIPIITINYLLKKACSQGMLIHEKGDCYKIIKEKFIDFANNELEYSTEVSIMVSAYVRFLSYEKKIKKEFQTAKEEILNFYVHNSDDFIKMLRNQTNCLSEKFKDFADFSLKMKIEGRNEFNCIKKLFFGSAIASLIQKDEVNKLLEQPEKNVDEVILDTNVLFGLYGFQSSVEKEMCEETLQILKDNDIKVSVISDTINEFYSCFERVIKNYDIIKRYRGIISSAQKKGGGMYSYIIKSGITKSDFLIMSNSIKENIISMGINIIDEYGPLEIDNQQKEELVVIKSANCGDLNSNNLSNRCEHDLKMIEYIKKNRLAESAKHSDAKLWALTFDEKLIGWNKKIKSNIIGVEECISVTRLINILWLNNMECTTDVALTSLILQLSNNQTINDSQIISFINKFDNLVKEEKIDEVKFNILCNSDFFENEDTFYNKDEVELFDRVNLLLENKKIQDLINDKCDPIQMKIDQLNLDINGFEKQNENIDNKDLLLKSSIDIRDNVYKKKYKKAKLRFKVEIILLSIVTIIFLFFCIYNWLKYSIKNEVIQILVPIVFDIILFVLSMSIPAIKRKLKEIFFKVVEEISSVEVRRILKVSGINIDKTINEFNNNLKQIQINLKDIQKLQETINEYQKEIDQITLQYKIN